MLICWATTARYRVANINHMTLAARDMVDLLSVRESLSFYALQIYTSCLE